MTRGKRIVREFAKLLRIVKAGKPIEVTTCKRADGQFKRQRGKVKPSAITRRK